MTSLIVHSSPLLKGSLKVPGDKSISHRAIIFGSLARGTTRISNLLEGEDVLCTAEIFRELGVDIQKKGNQWIVKGSGRMGLRSPSKILYCGNSGTTLRLMTGLLSGYSPVPLEATLTGDASLNARPMGRVIEPLRQMGAIIEETRNEQGRFIKVASRKLDGGSFSIKVASAQLKTALLLAGLYGDEPVIVKEPIRSRDHSERMLKAFGADLTVRGLKVILKPGRVLKGRKVVVPGDFSSAAFFIVAGLISKNKKSRLVLQNIGMNPTRTGALIILKKMGGRIRILSRRTLCGEPVADLEIRPSQLRGVKIPPRMIPSLIDEIPILSVAASVAKGKTMIKGAEELRVKETDRIKALATELPRFGIKVLEKKDGLEITGQTRLKAAQGQSYGDHRMAMSLAVLGTIAEGETFIDDTDCIRTSFPNFIPLMRQIGIQLREYSFQK